MESVVVACMQPRLTILASHEEFNALARRFMRQSQAKGATLTIFPELTGLMLAPPLISGFRLGMIRRADRGRQPGAGFVARRLGRVANTTADVLGGGLAGSLARLLRKDSEALRDATLATFGGLAREFSTALVGGSQYLCDGETGTVRNRAYVFDAGGEVMGYQDKLNLAPEEKAWAVPGTDLGVFQMKFGRVGVLIGQDVLYPELARLLSVQDVDVLVNVLAVSGAAEANLLRSALAIRAEENEVFGAASFLLGPNYLDDREDYCGQSALLAPVMLSEKRDGVLLQAGSARAESVVTGALPAEALYTLRQSGRMRLRREMNLGNLGPVLAEMYERGLTIEQAIEHRIAAPEKAASVPAPLESAESPAGEAMPPTLPVPETPPWVEADELTASEAEPPAMPAPEATAAVEPDDAWTA